MAENFRTYVVVNPRSANGSTGRLWPQIARSIECSVGPFEHCFTDGPLHAAELARTALAAGAEMIVSIGGDGTHNEVANGFFREDGSPVSKDAVLGIISRGTGCDFIKTLGLPKDYEAGAPVLAGRATRTIDAGRIDLTPHEGVPAVRYFINIADFGLGGVAVDKVNHTTKAFGAKISFYVGTLRAMFAYKAKPMRVELDDGREMIEGNFLEVVVANGRFFGGGMKIAPKAEPDDGLFDVIFIGDFTVWETIKMTGAIYRGTLEKNPKVFSRRARRVRASSERRVLLDVDGEQPGLLSATLQVLPQAIRIKVPE